VIPLLIAALALIVAAASGMYYLHQLNRRLARAEAEVRTSNASLISRLGEIETLNRRIQEQAIRDPITGLYNRRYLEEMLEREVARAKREGYPISLALIDLDYFKRVNDTYGHQAGDLVLQTLGKLLLESAREGDIACRYGGEEFVLVLPRLSVEHAFHRAEEWRLAFAKQTTRHGDLEITATMSIGLATYPLHAANSDELINQADLALYNAKHAGRNRTAIAS
jgi:diguanylate cyclase (GGDEF)-like protein